MLVPVLLVILPWMVRNHALLGRPFVLSTNSWFPIAVGNLIPRDIITLFTCRYNGEEIFRAELSPAIASNPFLSFFTTARESGTLEFHWSGDNGFVATETAAITVE